jgi:hypothetical protein
MTVTLPIASSAAASSGPSSAPVAPMPERQIFDYAMEVQQGAINDGGRLANPAALVGELVERLRPFFERAQRISKYIDQGNSTSESSLRATDANESRLSMHGGPARAPLDPVGGGLATSDETNDRFDLLAKQIADEMFDVAIYKIQATLLARSEEGISTSVNTLLRGS